MYDALLDSHDLDSAVSSFLTALSIRVFVLLMDGSFDALRKGSATYVQTLLRNSPSTTWIPGSGSRSTRESTPSAKASST